MDIKQIRDMVYNGKMVGDFADTYLKEVIDFMQLAHLGQVRKDGSDYWHHPYLVYRLLLSLGISNTDILTVALLHDVIEDTKFDQIDIENEFGNSIAEKVKLLTVKITSETNKTHEKQIQILNHAKNWTYHCAIVKLADRYLNLKDAIECWQSQKVKEYAKHGLEIYDVSCKMIRETRYTNYIKWMDNEYTRFLNCLI